MVAAERVFVVGMFKTGTSSVVKALRHLGYAPAVYNGYSSVNAGARSAAEAPKQYSTVTYLDIPGIDPLCPSHLHDTIREGPHWDDIVSAASRATLFADAPWLYLYREWDALYPSGSRFVLTLRKGGGAAGVRSDLAMWKRLDLYMEVREVMDDDEILKSIEERYDAHNREVREYFAGRDNLLELCLGDNEDHENWAALSSFVHGPASMTPMMPFPRENTDPKRGGVID